MDDVFILCFDPPRPLRAARLSEEDVAEFCGVEWMPNAIYFFATYAMADV